MRSRVRAVFEDSGKRNVALAVAASANLLLILVNLLVSGELLPRWVLIAMLAVEVLFVWPVLVAVVVFLRRDLRARNRNGWGSSGAAADVDCTTGSVRSALDADTVIRRGRAGE